MFWSNFFGPLKGAAEPPIASFQNTFNFKLLSMRFWTHIVQAGVKKKTNMHCSISDLFKQQCSCVFWVSGVNKSKERDCFQIIFVDGPMVQEKRDEIFNDWRLIAINLTCRKFDENQIRIQSWYRKNIF